MKIEIKQTEGLEIPKTGTEHSSGYDVVAVEEPNIIGLKTEDGLYYKSIDYIEYKTKISISPQIEDGKKYHVLALPRSSIRKYNLVLANGIGLVDLDYRGEILLCFKYIFQPEDLKIVNNEIVGSVNQNKIYKVGDRIGQLLSEISNPIEWIPVLELNKTNRGNGGFGSTNSTITNTESIQQQKSNTISLSKNSMGNVFFPSVNDSQIENKTVYNEKTEPLSDEFPKQVKVPEGANKMASRYKNLTSSTNKDESTLYQRYEEIAKRREKAMFENK